MALIKCPECGAQVSSMAESCPKCAYPIAGGGTTQASGGKIQTVEQTSKRYKLHKLLSVLLIIISFVIIISSNGSTSGLHVGIIGVIVGLIWYIFTSFVSWWHHG
ncbi:MAG TPA: hypothetical protein PLX58_10620 [Smithellaceae bacterium]|jgi:uncharacterized membrane protein YvbJ|nr:hypothetical protein [Smithellaceae bacterium]HQG81624.1 hypothetical protein [Smithellaceae bacterium]